MFSLEYSGSSASFFAGIKSVILAYHGFSDVRNHNGSENSSFNHVFIEDFKRQVRFLKKYYRVRSPGRGLGIAPFTTAISTASGHDDHR